MGVIVDSEHVTMPGGDGWKCIYQVRRDDGEVVTVDVSCTGAAQAVAEATDNAEALVSMENLGGVDALQMAEKVQSPARRGETLITIVYDETSRGDLRWDVSYERDPEPG